MYIYIYPVLQSAKNAGCNILEFSWKHGLATVLLKLEPSEPNRVSVMSHT